MKIPTALWGVGVHMILAITFIKLPQGKAVKGKEEGGSTIRTCVFSRVRAE